MTKIYPQNHDGNSYRRLLSVLLVGYVFAATGLVGLPRFSRLGIVFAAALVSAELLGVRRRKLHLAPWLVLPLLFYSYAALLTIDSTAGWVAIGQMFTIWVGAAAVGIAVENGVDPKYVIFAGTAATISSFAAYQLGYDVSVSILGLYDSVEQVRRVSGLMGNANLLAVTAGTWVFLGLVVLRGRITWKAVLCVVLAYAVTITGSRKGAIALMLLLLLLFLYPLNFYRGIQRRYVVLMTLLALLLMMVGMQWFLHLVSELEVTRRFLAIQDGTDDSYLSRLEFYRVGLDLIGKNPVFGYGLDSFRQVSRLQKYSHSNYIELLVNGGFVFFVLYYAHHAAIIATAFRLPDSKRYWILGFVIFLLVQDTAAVTYLVRPSVLALVLVLAESASSSRRRNPDRLEYIAILKNTSVTQRREFEPSTHN